MRSLALAALATTMLLTPLAAPVGAKAAEAERAYQLQTRIVEQAPSVGEFDGSLQLRVSVEGVVSGYYRPDDNPRFVPVTGGVKGDRFWLEIGSRRTSLERFNGVFKDGRIDAQSNGPFLDDGRYTGLELIATPRPG